MTHSDFRSRARRSVALVLVALIGLSACGLNEPPPPCPPAAVPKPLGAGTTFTPGGGQDLTEVQYSTQITGIQLTCDYGDAGVDLEVGVRIVAERGPADRDRVAKISYFVAVEQGVGNITAKQVYDLSLPFEGNKRRVGTIEVLDVFVPRPPDGNFTALQILGGLQLTPEQLEYNQRIATPQN